MRDGHNPIRPGDPPTARSKVGQALSSDASPESVTADQGTHIVMTSQNCMMPFHLYSNVGQAVVQQPGAAVQKTVDQPSVAAQTFGQPEEHGEQQAKDDNTPSPYASLDSATSDSGKEDEENVDEKGMDVGSQGRATMPESDKCISLVDKYAFNFAREAYDHRVPQHLTNGITLHVGSLAPMTTSLKQHREEEGGYKLAYRTPDLLPRPIELQKGHKTIECVWIGMLPCPNALSKIHSKVEKPTDDAGGEENSKKLSKKKKTKTVADIREDEMEIIDYDQEALRIVAKKSDKVTKDTHIYALLEKYEGHLQGFKVGFDDVFYFRDFRDDTTKSVMPRKQATTAKVRASIFPTAALAMSQSLTPNIDEVGQSVPAPSKPAPKGKGKEKKDGSVEPSKRKAEHPLIDIMMKQRGEARKKAKTEGCYVSPSDSEMSESVKDDDNSPMDQAGGHLADADKPSSDQHVSTAVHTPMNVDFGDRVADEAYSKHAVGAEDPGLLSPKELEDLTEQLTRAARTAEELKTLLAQGQNSNRQMINKVGEIGNPINTNNECYDGEEGQSSRAPQTESDTLAGEIKELTNKLATSQDIAGLQQALTMVRCIQDRRDPPKTSALGICFNVPSSKDIPIEDCADQLTQLRALFQGLEDHDKVQDHVLAWMVKGLQMTGQSLSIDILRPYLIAFADQYQTKCGSVSQGRIDRMSRNVLVDMICCARDRAEETLRQADIERSADSATQGDCPSHPYFDPSEEVVYRPAVWERPNE
ncbi:hypothetical protein N0V82_007974 [Gnomoniopsis sp. IMI 355080]|nr:hypothetical protein N0V82_007974 [Gnomoniopsis sp. IMI 355080]